MFSVQRVFAAFLALGIGVSLSSATAQAARYWDVAGTGTWEAFGNWTGDVAHTTPAGEPTVTETTVFGDNYVTGGTAQITQAGEVSRRLWLGYLAGKSGTLDISSGSLTLGWAGDTDGGYLRVGESGTGIVNQSGGEVVLGFETGHVSELQMARNASAVGTYNLSNGTLTTTDVVYGAGTGTINQTGGTITVTGGVVNGLGASVLHVDNGTMTVGSGFAVDTLRVGYEGGTGTLTVSGGAVAVGTGSNNLLIGFRDTGDDPTLGTVNLGAAGSVVLDLVKLHLGTDNTGDSGSGNKSVVGVLTLSSAGSNTVNATEIILGSTNSAQNISVVSELHFGGATNTINTDMFTIGGSKSRGLVDIAAGGTLALGGKSGSKTALRIGYNAQDTGTSPLESVLNLTGGTFNATLSTLEIGRHDRGVGSGKGKLIMDAGTVTADSITLAQVSVGGTSTAPGNTTGTLQVNGGAITVSGSVVDGGGTSTINNDNGSLNVGGDLSVDTLRVGYLPSGASANRTSTVTVTGGGNVAIGSATTRTNLYLGYNTAANQYSAVGTLDLTGAAQLDAFVQKLSLGEVTVAGDRAGRGQGILKLPALANIDAREILVSWSDAYGVNQPTSRIELGTTSNFKVDTFTVGSFRGFAVVEFATTGTLSLTGSSGAEADLLIANCSSTNFAANGHMDMSGGTFNATLDQLLIGYDGGGSGNGGTVGKLTFSAGTVTANSLTLGNAPTDGLGNGTLAMSGGSLTVNGNASLGAGTSVSIGTINLSGGTINVTGNVSGGIGASTVNVTGGGSLTVAGTVDVDSLTLNGSTATIDAGTIDLSSGGTFDFLDGTLHVDQFNGNLWQQGGVLAPGNSPGITNIDGDYTLASGTLQIEIVGTQYDQLIVDGDVSLAGELEVLLDGSGTGGATSIDDLYWIINNISEGNVVGEFANFAQGEAVDVGGRNYYVYYHAQYGTNNFYGGNDVLLSTIPEPSTMVALLGLAGMGLLGCTRRRRQR